MCIYIYIYIYVEEKKDNYTNSAVCNNTFYCNENALLLASRLETLILHQTENTEIENKSEKLVKVGSSI